MAAIESDAGIARQRTPKEDLALVTRSPEEAWTLPPRAYISPEIYELEKQQIFDKGWLLVGRVDQIPSPGDYFTYDLLSHKLVVVRSSQEEIHCFSRVCIHRGALLASGTGNCKTFVCPYHSWSYDLDGKLRSARDLPRSLFTGESARLPAVRTEVWNGFIFVNFDLQARPLSEQLTHLDEYLRDFRMEDMVLREAYVEFDTRTNWKVLCENFMEAYHHPGTHNPLLQKPFPYTASYCLDNHGQPWSFLVMPNPAEEDTLLLPAIPTLKDWRRTGLFAAIVYPNTLLAFTGDTGIWYQMLLHSHDHFTLRIRLLVPRSSIEVPDYPEIEKTYLEQFFRPLHQQDEAINDSVWAGLNTPSMRQGRLHPKYELSIWQMNQWWCARMASHL